MLSPIVSAALPGTRTSQKAHSLVRLSILLLAAALVTAGCSRDPNVLKKKYLDAGNRYFDKQKYREASIMYRTAIRKDPRYGEAYYRNGLAQIRENRFGEAEGSFRRAVELLPEGPERVYSRVQLGDIYVAILEGSPKAPSVVESEVERLSAELLKLDPKSFDGLRIRGALRSVQAVELSGKHPAEALEALRAAIVDLRAADAITPYRAEVVSTLARVLWGNGQPAEAEKYLKGLLKAQPGFSSAYGELKRFYLKTNRLADAEEILKSGAANLPDRQNEFLAQLAELYQKTGRRADMTRTLERLKSQASKSPSAFEL